MPSVNDSPSDYHIWQSVYPSWYPAPEVTKKEEVYLKMIESVFKVKYPDGTWGPIKLTNHQAEFHKDDLVIKQYNALSEVIIKSRNTSLTTDGVIRFCTNTYEFKDQIAPIVRINDKKVMELISKEMKEIIEKMTPLTYTQDDGSVIYWPFNNKLVRFTAHEITIPDRDVTITGYPSSSRSSENIRGLRINYGFNDECLLGNVKLVTNKGVVVCSGIYKNIDNYKLASYNLNNNKVEFKEIVHKNKRTYNGNVYYVKMHNQGYSIKCTDTHPFYDDTFKIKPISEFKVNDNLISFTNKNSYKLNKIQLEILYGVLLGDGNISLYNKYKSAIFSTCHSIKQMKYLDHIVDIFNLKKEKVKKTSFGGNVIKAYSKISNEYKDVYNKLYIKNKKTISSNYLNKLTDISLAYWFMDDGCRVIWGATLATHSFSYAENILIKNWFKNKYDIDVVLLKDKRCNKAFIKFNKKNALKLSKIISPYIIPSMKYKLSKDYNDYKEIKINKNNYKIYKIKDIVIKNERRVVYNFEVENNHNYLVSGMKLLSHNCNFEIEFQNIDIAMQDASRGATISGENIGKKALQLTYGTTRKGRFTSFNLWLENIEMLNNTGFDSGFIIRKWPALDPKKVNLNEDLTKQDLVPIVPWLTLVELEKRRRMNLNRFKEEYMAMLVDETDKLYDIQFIRDNLLNNNKNFFLNSEDRFSLDKSQWPNKQGKWHIGIDPAYSNDMFSISVFNDDDINYNQEGLYYKIGVDLTYMQDVCQDLSEHFMPLGLEMMNIDGNGLGVQLSNYLKKLFPHHVRVVRGNRIKINRKQSVGIKEYLHTNQLEKQMNKKVTYLRDSVQLMHFSGWQYDYNFEKVESDLTDDMAHGDTTISNAHALLPKNLNSLMSGSGILIGNQLSREARIEESKKDVDIKNKEITIEEKLKMYKLVSKAKMNNLF